LEANLNNQAMPVWDGLIEGEPVGDEIDGDSVRMAMAEWVGTLRRWDVFVTVTARPPDSAEQDRGYTRRGIGWLGTRYARLLAECAHVDVGVEAAFSVVEAHETGVPHIHALWRVTDKWEGEEGHGTDIRRGWRFAQTRARELCGWSQFRRLDDERLRAIRYVAKYTTKGVVDSANRLRRSDDIADYPWWYYNVAAIRWGGGAAATGKG